MPRQMRNDLVVLAVCGMTIYLWVQWPAWERWPSRPGNQLYGHSDHVCALACSPDGSKFASGSRDGAIIIWNADGRKILQLPGHVAYRGTTAVAFSPDGQHLASVGGDGAVRIWSVSDGRATAVFEYRGESHFAICYAPDGATIVSGGFSEGCCEGESEGEAILWDAESADPKMALPFESWVSCLEYAMDGITLAIGTVDGDVFVLDSQSGTIVEKLRHQPFEYSTLLALKFSPDGQFLATAADTVILWRVQDFKANVELPGHKVSLGGGAYARGVYHLAFSPDGDTLASSGADGKVRFWDVKSGKEKGSIHGSSRWAGKGAIALAFSPSGDSFAYSHDDVVTIIETARIEALREPGPE